MPPATDGALPAIARASAALSGRISVPGDKSISHRALMLSSQVLGHTRIEGLLEGEDVLATAGALRELGVTIVRHDDGSYVVSGVGVGGLAEPSSPLDMGNAGTGARLLMGLLASYPFLSVFVGDASLSSRPMQRVIDPLSLIGAEFMARSKGRLPLAMRGSDQPVPIEYALPMPSAQVKSAVLLAGLNIAGRTTVIEKEATRDHTERMLRSLGFAVESVEEAGGLRISLAGHQEIPFAERHIRVPGDPSSAAFPVVAALIVPGSELVIERVCVNPLRTGLFTTLIEMGADLAYLNEREEAGEPIADLRVRHSKLKGVEVPAERAPSMIDEYPILAVAAAFAEGDTVMRGLDELRVKESDRLSAILDGLTTNGVACGCESDACDLIVTGGTPTGGGVVKTQYDHRIAMSFLVMGLATAQPVKVDDTRAIATSFPGFLTLMQGLGADVAVPQGLQMRGSRTQMAPPRPLVRKPRLIAIDGPAASGKGTLARRIADHYGYAYLDTGSLYRAVGLKLVYTMDRDPADREAALEAAKSITDQDLANPRLRQERVAQAASIVSAMPEVRAALLDFQRDYARRPEGAVLDGRDIGTVVCPEAEVKIYMLADLKARADRRYRELTGEGLEVVYESVLRGLRERDERDEKRSIAPLIAARDAVVIDTTHHSAQDVFEQVIAHIEGLPVRAAG